VQGELTIDVYTVKLRLSFLVPEFLPIRGKRARVYYHGIQPFCVQCYTPGHHRSDCFNHQVSWIDYTESLKVTGIPARLFDPVTENIFNNSGLASSTPMRNLNPNASLHAGLISFLQNYSQNQSQSPNQSLNPVFPLQVPDTPPNRINPIPNPVGQGIINPIPVGQGIINPIPRPVTRSRLNAQSQSVPAPRGRGQGRGWNRGTYQNVNQDQQAQSNQVENNNFNNRTYRGRGRGRPLKAFTKPSRFPRGNRRGQ